MHGSTVEANRSEAALVRYGFGSYIEPAHSSPRDITMGALLSIACCMTVAGQKQRPTTSLRLNVSTSTTRKLTPSPVQSLWYVVYRAYHRCTQQTSSIAVDDAAY